MLIGQYDYAIDAKGRINFPARFRGEMGESFVVEFVLRKANAKENVSEV